MAKDSIANQKVNVKLSSVLEIQENFQRLQPADKSKSAASQLTGSQLGYLRGIAYVIKTLELPITIPNGF